jgi:hypothetical protein
MRSMQVISIRPITKGIIVRYDGGHVLLPADLQKDVDDYWEERIIRNSGV